MSLTLMLPMNLLVIAMLPFFFPQSQVTKLCENNFSQKKLCENNTANLLQTNKNLYFYILSQK